MTVKEAILAQKTLIKELNKVVKLKFDDKGEFAIAVIGAVKGIEVIEKELKELQKELDKAHKRYQDFANMF